MKEKSRHDMSSMGDGKTTILGEEYAGMKAEGDFKLKRKH